MAFVFEEKIGEENARKYNLDKVQKILEIKFLKIDCHSDVILEFL